MKKEINCSKHNVFCKKQNECFCNTECPYTHYNRGIYGLIYGKKVKVAFGNHEYNNAVGNLLKYKYGTFLGYSKTKKFAYIRHDKTNKILKRPPSEIIPTE